MTVKRWPKKIKVDKRIVRLLSTSTYEDFPGAIKEMVSNAFDADATEVNIEVNLQKDFITVSDNGNGMLPDEFDFYLRIAGQQRSRQYSPSFGRKRIGQFGIGFMAIFPFGKKIIFHSTSRKSDIKFEATIPTEQFIKDDQEGISIDVENIPIPGQEILDKKIFDEHGTTVKILGLTSMVHRFFKESDIKFFKQRQTIKRLPPLEKLAWILSEDLPLEYPLTSSFNKAFKDIKGNFLIVRLNGKQLFRNVHASNVLEDKTWQSEKVKCRYVIATNWKSVTPFEARGLKVRLGNVGVGKRKKFGLGTEGRAYSRLHWLTGEILILEGFDKLITIDRKGFRESPEYDVFFEYFRSRLSYNANYLEIVATAQRDINRQITEDRSAEFGPREKIINKNIKKLTERGFKVISKPANLKTRQIKPVHVNLKKKVIKVIDDHPKLHDQIVIDFESVPVRYINWNYENEKHPAIREAIDGIIEINLQYPLFKSKRYGDIFRKVFLLLTILIQKNKRSVELIPQLSKKFLEEFEDLI